MSCKIQNGLCLLKPFCSNNLKRASDCFPDTLEIDFSVPNTPPNERGHLLS